MKEYLAVLLFILPGFACKSLFEWMKNGKNIEETMDGAGKDDSWKYIILSLLYSIWVLAAGYLIMSLFTRLPSIDGIRRQLDRPAFVLGYAAAMMVSCALVAGIWRLIQRPVSNLAAKILRKLGSKWTREPELSHQCVILRETGEEKIRGYVKRNPFPYRGREEWDIEPYPVLEDLTPGDIKRMTRRYYYNSLAKLEVILLDERELKKWLIERIRASESQPPAQHP